MFRNKVPKLIKTKNDKIKYCHGFNLICKSFDFKFNILNAKLIETIIKNRKKEKLF